MSEELTAALTPAGFLFVGGEVVSNETQLQQMTGVSETPKADGFRVYCLRLVRFRDEKNLKDILVKLFKAFRRIEPGARVMVLDADYQAWKNVSARLMALGTGGVRSIVSSDQTRKVAIKRYHRHASTYFRRECAIYTKIADLPGTCPILDLDEDRQMYEMPLIEGGWSWQDRGWNLFPVAKARAVFNYMHALHRRGIYMVDWNPRSFLFDQNGGLQVVDFEFAYEKANIPSVFAHNADFQGIGHEIEMPGCSFVSYERDWQEIIGLTYEQLVHASTAEVAAARGWHLVSVRLPNYLLRLPKKLFGPLKQRFRMARKAHRCDGATILKIN
ncbi:hypothetical protein LPB41_12920 [Thalassospira sp. MA62]|nr:hypothetical protein [Thalassospira sp. MA62]